MDGSTKVWDPSEPVTWTVCVRVPVFRALSRRRKRTPSPAPPSPPSPPSSSPAPVLTIGTSRTLSSPPAGVSGYAPIHAMR
eukprot:6193986-Pleurochrysis_carterae.AAC.1